MITRHTSDEQHSFQLSSPFRKQKVFARQSYPANNPHFQLAHSEIQHASAVHLLQRGRAMMSLEYSAGRGLVKILGRECKVYGLAARIHLAGSMRGDSMLGNKARAEYARMAPRMISPHQ